MRKKENKSMPIIYWTFVIVVLISLLLLINHVLDSSKVFIKDQGISPTMINWRGSRDKSLRISDPFYIRSDSRWVKEDSEALRNDSELYRAMIILSSQTPTLEDVPTPYLLWKKQYNDTIHVLRNNVHLKFIMRDR